MKKIVVSLIILTSSFGSIFSVPFTSFFSLKECLATYKKAFEDFEPEVQYATVNHKITHKENDVQHAYSYHTKGSSQKLNHYLKEFDNLSGILTARLLFKGLLLGLGSAITNKLLRDWLMHRKVLLTVFAMGSSIAIAIDENNTISKEQIPYFEPTTLNRESDLCSNKNIEVLFGKWLKVFLPAALTFFGARYALDTVL